MAKRSARYKTRENSFADAENVRPLFPARSGWNPRDGEARDRKYVKNVRAMSPTQQRFMDAIDERAVPGTPVANHVPGSEALDAGMRS